MNYLESWIEYNVGIANDINKTFGHRHWLSVRRNQSDTVGNTMRSKVYLMNSNVMSIILYASDYRKLIGETCSSKNMFWKHVPSKILNIPWYEKVINIEVRQRAGHPLVTDLLKRRSRIYLGELRMPGDWLPCTVYEWHPEGRRKRGRPRRMNLSCEEIFL